MTNAFRRRTWTKLFLKKKLLWNCIFNENFQNTVEIGQWDSLIGAILKGSTKGAMTGAFRRATYT